MKLVDLREGDWALCMESHFCSMDGDPASSVLNIAWMFQTWDYIRRSEDIFYSVPVMSVRKVTFLSPSRRQFRREYVVAALPSKEAANDLAKKIVQIAADADRAYHDGIREVSSRVSGQVCADAKASISHLMPHLFSGAAA